MADSSAGRTFFYGVIGIMIMLAVVFVIYQRRTSEQRMKMLKEHGPPNSATRAPPRHS